MKMRLMPFLLTTLRLALAPVMVLTAYYFPDAILFLICLSCAFVSDIYDGILARRFGVATERLRRFDSLTDLVFYAAVFIAIGIVHPQVIRGQAVPLALLLSLELCGQFLALALSGKPAAVHSYTAKLWGICLFLATCEVLVGGAAGVLFHWMLVVGFFMYAEWLIILLLTGGRGIDVKSVFHLQWTFAGPPGR